MIKAPSSLRAVYGLIVVSFFCAACSDTDEEKDAASALRECELLASHPWEDGNPETGVPWDKIDQAEALEACQAAIAEPQPSSKAHYWLGRVLHVSKKYDDALDQYEKAKPYAPALLNMGVIYMSGLGSVPENPGLASASFKESATQGFVPAQYQYADYLLGSSRHGKNRKEGENWLSKAATAGYEPAQKALETLQKLAKELLKFRTGGYSNPEFFAAIYEGRTDEIRLKEVGLYLTAFMSMFTNADIPECRTVVSQTTLMRIGTAGSADILGNIFEGLAQAHRDRSGGRDERFGEGFEAGSGTFGGMMLEEASAQSDAQLFYNEHGCDSRVAVRFFGNVEDLR